MVKYNFKDICVVPSAENFVDIMLSKTNRQTPTVVRARWKISSIRQFYMRKIRFTQQNMVTRLSKILEEFPRLDSIHPFYSDLMNVLYDRDHYKIALSQLNIAKQLITSIGRDYIKLLKYGDSLYRCKQLKRAALGRMVKILKQQKASLSYLEQVRQHIGRLPSIDPHEKTILLTGFPSTGKSSFMNKITNANVEVKAYPFTTKSLYVGHCDYDYCRYQIIDSPGILDRTLQERNTIEMQAITALAHLNCAILYFIDLSPVTNYSIKQQCKLFHSLIPLFGNKPVIVICNKTDLRKFNELANEEKNLISKISNMKNVKMMEMSNETECGIMNVRNEACNMLLSHRIEIKTSNNKLKNIEHRLFIAQPIKRDNKERKSVLAPIKKTEKNKKSIKEIERENGGPGVFNFDVRNHWNLKNDEWRFDPIPQFYDGKNITDFYQKNIVAQLNNLENEEQEKQIQIEQEINNNAEEERKYEINDDDELLVKYITRKHILKRKESSQIRKTRDSRPQIGRSDKKISIHKLRESLDDLGIDTRKVSKTIKNEEDKKKESLFNRRGRSRIRSSALSSSSNNSDFIIKKSGLDLQEIARKQSRSRNRNRSVSNSNNDNRQRSRSRSRSRSRAPSKGISSVNASISAEKLKKKAIHALQTKAKYGRVHESDRRIYTSKPLHLFKVKHHPKGR